MDAAEEKCPTKERKQTLRDAIWLAIREPGSLHSCPVDELGQLSTWEVKPDGRCLWYSLVAGSALSRGMAADALEEADSRGELVREARLLRKRICRELTDIDTGDMHPRYAPFWAAGEEGTEGVTTPREYLERLSQGTLFGGALELHALAQMGPCCVVVVNVPVGASTGGCAYVTAHRAASTSLLTAPVMVVRRALHYDAAFFGAQRATRAHSLPPATTQRRPIDQKTRETTRCGRRWDGA